MFVSTVNIFIIWANLQLVTHQNTDAQAVQDWSG